jgi:hypothetical protein
VTDLYQIQTETVSVEVTFDSGAPLVGRTFLRPSATHAGLETIEDRLNDAAACFPVRVDHPAPATLLVSKSRIRYVVAPSQGRDERIASERAAATQIGMTAWFDDDFSVTGILFIDLPPNLARALDYVNDADRKFVALAQPGRDVFVNRALIRFFHDSV